MGAQPTRLAWQSAALAASTAAALWIWAGGYGTREQPFNEPFSWSLLQQTLGGLAWLASGVVLLGRESARRMGALLMASGALILVTRLIDSRVPVLFSIGLNLQFLLAPLVVLTLLAYPTGHARGKDRAVVAALLVIAGLHAASGVLYDPALHWCPTCPPGMNVILLSPQPQLLDSLYPFFITSYGAGYLYVAGAVLVHWVTAGPVARRVRSPMLVPAFVYGVLGAAFFFYEAGAEWGLFLPSVPLRQAGVVVWFAQLVLPVTFLAGLGRARVRRGRVADLVTELGDSPPADRLEDALRRTLRDPSLEVGYWSAEAGAYRTADGTPLEPPTGDRVTTVVHGESGPLAVLVHEAALLEDARLLDATAAAARLAIENARLAAELRVQLEEVRASRWRIVQAGDAARRRVERDLHDGAQQRLVSLSLLLRQARGKLDGAGDMGLDDALAELDAAMAELRELARGVYPLALAEGGLAAALDSLAERAAVPTVVEACPPQRLPEPVEVAAYFVATEAIANAAKHADATVARVSAVVRDGRLVMTVTDDGRGGAMPQPGGGLLGLADRVQALGGTLAVTSPQGDGTTVRAEVPCASP